MSPNRTIIKPQVTPDLARQALQHIPANMPRDEWARVAMALKSEWPDSTGFELFDTWSQSAADGYNSKSTRDTWKSVKAGGGVSIGTLLHLAKSHGFRFPRSGDALPPPPDSEEAERLAREREAIRQQDREQEQAAQAAAAVEAEARWASAADSGRSAYLERKCVAGYGVRYTPDGWLLVPLRDEGGKLWNLQRIAPAKPAEGSDKLFLKGGRKSGLWHLLGAAAGLDSGAVLLLAEGYATAATLHAATGFPVAVAFDAGNLSRVAKALRKQYPGVLIVVCGDDDRDTEARTGINGGRVAAQRAAQAVGGLVAFPEDLPEGGSDFNDIHVHHGQVDGLQRVKSIVEGVIQVYRATQDATKTPAADGPAHDWDRFTVTPKGVFYQGVDRDGEPTKPEWVCSGLTVEALTRDEAGNAWGYLLTFADPLGREKQWAMPARMLAGDGGEYRSMLLAMGLRIATSPRARNLLIQYIQTRQPGVMALCTERVGWHGRAYVRPHETIGEQDERIVHQTDAAMENTLRVRGTVAQWRESVAGLAAGNSRLVFALCAAFAGPLMRPAGIESGGFHFRGDSSSGKTTALKVAASVWGGASYLQRWRTTDNALESIAAQHCDGLLILDELAQVDPRTAGECAYMLANEQSKARATRNGMPRARLTWRLLFLSAGELGLADHMAEGQKRARTGQEVRMADIPADAGVGLGAFQQLHGHEGGAAFSSHLCAQAARYHGSVGRAWLEWLTQHIDGLRSTLKQRMAALQLAMVPDDASGQVHRVGARFALLGVAGELATEAGLTGWQPGEAEKAVSECFNAWLSARGGKDNGEVHAMLRQVRRFLEQHADGRFTWWHRAGDDHAPKTLFRAGFRRMVAADGEPIKTHAEHVRRFGETVQAYDTDSFLAEYFVLPETFRQEVCQGFDPDSVCKVLKEVGALSAESGRNTRSVRLPGMGKSKVFHLLPKIFEI